MFANKIIKNCSVASLDKKDKKVTKEMCKKEEVER